MEEEVNISINWFNNYINSFKELTAIQKRNFEYKKEHSVRVAELSLNIAQKLKLTEEECQTAYVAGLFHDIGRFKQQVDYDTFRDDESEDHGDLAVDILNEAQLFTNFPAESKNKIVKAVQNHNKYKIQDGLTEGEMLMSKLVRDADKLDIFKVLADYYPNRKNNSNHVFASNLPRGTTVSPAVLREVLSGKLVSKHNLQTELDLKIMQMSWVYDLNFKPSIDSVIRNRFLEIIYNTMPKNDLIIDIHRKIKVFTENKILVK